MTTAPGPSDLDGLVQDLVDGLSSDPSVAAVAVVGSIASGRRSGGSDVDLFVYADTDLADPRRMLAERHADAGDPVLLGTDPFGDGDVWRHRASGTWVDLMVWSQSWAEEQLDRCLVRHEASMGYTTAFWRSIATSHAAYERDGWHVDLQRRASSAYPDELVRAIVELNLPWLGREHPFSFRHQVAKAVAREDRLSVNHRLAAWMASCFDVVFALNRVLHPGEKRMLEIALAECSVLPAGFEVDVVEALAATDPVPHLDRMATRLVDLVAASVDVPPR